MLPEVKKLLDQIKQLRREIRLLKQLDKMNQHTIADLQRLK